MAKHNASPVAVCPFYKNQERQRICCEGVEGSSSLHVAFSVPAARQQYEQKYCRCWNWEACPVARMLWRQYEPDDPVFEVKKLKRDEPRPGKKFSDYTADELRILSRRGGLASGKSRRLKRERIEMEKVENIAMAEERRDNLAMLRANAKLLLEVQTMLQSRG